MNKDEMEKIVNLNSIQIGKNSTNISVLMRLTYLVLAIILGQFVITLLQR